jgi:hypothetical protein
MPTKRRRHAITETPPVAAALDELRSVLGSDNVELGELVMLGARAKLAAIRDAGEADRKLRQSLASRVREQRLPVDVAAADEVRRRGFTRG